MTWTIYFLAIGPGVACCALFVGLALLGFACHLYLSKPNADALERDAASDEQTAVTYAGCKSLAEEYKAKAAVKRAQAQRMRDEGRAKPWRAPTVAGTALLVLAVAVPDRGALIEAYMMTEGVKVLHAENAGKAAVELRDQMRALVKALTGDAAP